MDYLKETHPLSKAQFISETIEKVRLNSCNSASLIQSDYLTVNKNRFGFEVGMTDASITHMTKTTKFTFFVLLQQCPL